MQDTQLGNMTRRWMSNSSSSVHSYIPDIRKRAHTLIQWMGLALALHILIKRLQNMNIQSTVLSYERWDTRIHDIPGLLGSVLLEFRERGGNLENLRDVITLSQLETNRFSSQGQVCSVAVGS